MISLDYSILYQVILFVVLWIVLSKILFRPYLALLDERERRTAGTQRESSALAQEGERLKAEYEEKIAQAQAAGAAAKEAILKEAGEQREKILAQAREEGRVTLERARSEVQSQVERERQLAINQIAVIAQDMAAKILGRKIA